jgi:hypothetical protein
MTYDFRRFTGVNDMNDAQRRACHEAGRPPLGPEPKPKPASPVAMNAEATRAWEAWLYGHLDRLAYEMGACSAEIENCVNAKIRGLEAEIGQLRAAAQVERAANNIVDLPNPLRRRSNAP